MGNKLSDFERGDHVIVADTHYDENQHGCKLQVMRVDTQVVCAAIPHQGFIAGYDPEDLIKVDKGSE